MDRMKTGALFLLAWLVFSGPVSADEWSYSPAYEASPSAKSLATPEPAVVAPFGRQPEVTCRLSITLPVDTRAPMEARLNATGKMDGQAINQFRYLFGDGESATGSGEVRHTYVQSGTYQIRVMPVIEGEVEVPICKSKIVVKESMIGEEEGGKVEPIVEPSPTVLATSAAEIAVQPKTGPTQWYWASLLSLLVVWLGAVVWYQRQHPRTG